MKNIAYIAFAVLGLIWGTNFLFMKWALHLISPTQAVLLRVLFGFLPILAFALWRRALSWSHLRHAHHFVVMALLATAVYYWAYAKGTVLLLSSVAGLLSGAIPLFTFICAWLFLREERLNARMAAGVVTGFLGILLIARPWEVGDTAISLEGVAYMAFGSVSVGSSFVYARRYLTGLGLSPWALCTYQMGFALLILLAVTDLNGIEHIADSRQALLGISLGMGLGGTGLAYMLYYFIVERLGAVVAASSTYIPPLVALVMGVAFAGDPFHLSALAGIAAVLGGVFILQSGRKLAQRKVAQAGANG